MPTMGTLFYFFFYFYLLDLIKLNAYYSFEHLLFLHSVNIVLILYCNGVFLSPELT